MGEEQGSTNHGGLGNIQEGAEGRMEVLARLRWKMGKVKEEAEDGRVLACNGMGTPGLSKSP